APVVPVAVRAPAPSSGALQAPVSAQGLIPARLAGAAVGIVMSAGTRALARQAIPIVAGAAWATAGVVGLVVIIRAQVTHAKHNNDDDKRDHSGQNDQRGLHDTIQHGVALGDARQPRAAIDASLP